MQLKKHKITRLKDYTPPTFLIPEANLQFILDPQETLVLAHLHIKRNPKATTKNTALELNGVNLELQKICLNKKSLTHKNYQLTEHTLTILNVPNDFILETVVKICPQKNLSCSGLYLSGNNFCTQNEPHGFRTITYFIDRPDILTKFTTNIIANKKDYPILLSNGNLLSQKQLASGYHQTIWQDHFPKSPYLFALVAGKFSCLEDYYITKTKRKITLRIYTNQKQLKQCEHAMHSLKQAIAWDEQTFGLEYDLDLYQIVAVDDFNFGAMENKGLNIFNSKLLLASKETATDNDFTTITSVVAHEYFHNWTGNRITCRDWFQLGLKEGLTTLREQLFMEDLYGHVINRLDAIKTIYQHQFPEDAGPLAHPIRLQSYIEVDNFYTATVYEKSAEVARMLIIIFGRKKFVRILRKFLTTYDGQPATIEDFLNIAAQVTKTDLTRFKLWYDQCGTPILKISTKWHKKKYTLQAKQFHPKAPKDFCIPLAIGLVHSKDKNNATTTLLITKKTQNFTFTNLTTKPTPSLLRNFSAPVKIEYPYTQKDLLFLAQYDADPINRWEAGQKLMISVIQELYTKHLAHKTLTLAPTLYELFKTILDTKNIDPALAAQMLKLPAINQLLETLPKCNIDILYYVYEFLRKNLINTLTQKFLRCYTQNSTHKSYTFKATACGKRELKNVCLGYLIYLETPKIYGLGKKQLTTADNLTDICAALVALANSRYTGREKLIARYYQKWRKQPNLVNKWLAINAAIKWHGNIKRVQKLLKHPGFNIKNPNNVYALIRTFCEGNLVNFHAADGSGYRFLTQQILTIDKFNPQLAAFMTVPLTHGHKLDVRWQKLLQKQLHIISKTKNLSAHVSEIVIKALITK